MIQLRWADVSEVVDERPGRLDLLVSIDGEQVRAIAYPMLTGPIGAGDRVLLNTTAVSLGLGTGGVHLVVGTDRDVSVGSGGHAIKLRYTPLQVAVDAVEETHRDAVDAVGTLEGMPVVAAGLHSAVPAVAIGARAAAPHARIAYVMTDGAALLMGFSDSVIAMRSAGLLDVTITSGQAAGGDLEAVNLYGALAAARAVAHADLAIVAMGPGNLGTGSRLGFALLEVAGIVNATVAMGGTSIVVPRVSFGDARDRHRGVSHHTITALAMALGGATIALPSSLSAFAEQIAPLPHHEVSIVDLGPAEEALRDSPVDLRTMGRGFDDDPEPFRAAAAAGVFAARLLGNDEGPP